MEHNSGILMRTEGDAMRQRAGQARRRADHEMLRYAEPAPKLSHAGRLAAEREETPVFEKFSAIAGGAGSMMPLLLS